jgi:hypothetical protein
MPSLPLPALVALSSVVPDEPEIHQEPAPGKRACFSCWGRETADDAGIAILRSVQNFGYYGLMI